MHATSRSILAAAGSVVSPIANGVFFVQGPLSNWVILTDGNRAGLIDCGYPRDLPLVRASITVACGRALPVGDVLLTHAHTDHMGTAKALIEQDGTQVHCAVAEVRAVRRQEVHQVGVRDVLARPRPAVLAWAYRAIRAGGLDDVGVSDVRALPETSIMIAGSRVVPISAAGHTPGHTAFWLPNAEAIATGDALVSAHPTSRKSGPQLLHPMFHHEPHQVPTSLRAIRALSARTLLPGHGAAIHVSATVAHEVDQALNHSSVEAPG